ncbi:hypothetical protein [Bdellovibrio sp.]|uniref:hypothetical protein n=1 Tax=Bdellovibrio sp. TaxID=28201 RepID=UPI0039E31A2C
MRWLGMVLSFLFGRLNTKPKSFREIALEIFDDVSRRSRKIVSLTLAGLGAVIFFCGGLFISIIDGTTQYDRFGMVNWTATFGAGVTLILFATAVFAVVFLRAWPGATQRHSRIPPHHEAPPPPSALEQALAALVMDFVKERELRREARSQAEPPPSSPDKEPDTTSSAHFH